ncbi:MAG TPA: hypothetical protein VLD67_07875 [Vicinamibacterales bacterium]|nr:hypothetical protein [Vicinamibacterales bacterium]
MRPMIRGRRTPLAVLAVLAAACSTPNTPTPAPDGTGLYDVTLEVFEQTPAGPQPVPSPRGMFYFHRPGDSYSTGNGFVAGEDGRHVFPHIPHGTEVKVRADKSSYHQPCSVGSRVVGNSTLRLELVRPGSQPGVWVSPILSGMVYRTTPQGREPVIGQAIGYIANCRGLVEAYGRTDGNGRYAFCRLPRGPGCVDTYWGFESEFGKQVLVNITGDLVVDIDIGQ